MIMFPRDGSQVLETHIVGTSSQSDYLAFKKIYICFKETETSPFSKRTGLKNRGERSFFPYFLVFTLISGVFEESKENLPSL